MINKRSYFDSNPLVFKILFSICLVFLTAIVFINLNLSSRTVFSGTNYMSLPSKIYIKSDFIAQKISENGQILGLDTIKSGSFILSLNSNGPLTGEKLDSIVNSSKDTVYTALIFNIKNADQLPDGTYRKFYYDLAGKYMLNKNELSRNNVQILKSGCFVGFIIKDGATSRAGIRPGDVIRSLNGKPIEIVSFPSGADALTIESLRFLRSHRGGDPIPYEILRENKITTFNVILATFGIQLMVAFLFICGIVFFIIGAFYAFKRPQIFTARIIGFSLILIGYLLAGGINFNPPGFSAFIYFHLAFQNIVSLFSFPLVFHTLNYFPLEHTELLKNKWNIRIPYIIAGITSVILLSIFIIDFTLLNNFLIPGCILFNVFAYTILRIKYHKKELPEATKKSRFLTISFCFVLVFIFLQPVSQQFNIPINEKLFQYTPFAILLIPASILFTTWYYRLLDIDFRIGRNVQYKIISFFTNIFAVALYLFAIVYLTKIEIQIPNLTIAGNSIEVLSQKLDAKTNLGYEKIVLLCFSFAFSYAYFRAVRRANEHLDKKFYRQKFDYKYMQTEVIELFESKRDLELAANAIVEKLTNLVHLKQLGLVFIKGNSIWGNKIFCYNSTSKEHCDFSSSGNLTEELIKFKTAIDITYLPDFYKVIFIEKKFRKLIPIKKNDKFFGALLIGEKLSETALNNDDIEFLISFSKNFSVAIENAFLYEELAIQERMKQELEVARKIQLSSLPQEVPIMAGIEISAISIPAYEVGGDFYDFLNGSASELTVVIGDVSGKGTSAALYMSKVQGILQTLHSFFSTPVELLNNANKHLYKHIDAKSFVTAIGAKFDTAKKTIVIARAGHLPLYQYLAEENRVDRLIPKGIGLGLCGEELFNRSTEEIEIAYKTGDIFLFISDGILEARDRTNQFYGDNRLESILLNSASTNSEAILNKIINSVKVFSGTELQSDDMTLVVVKCN